jgi:tRNA (adenine57-N1/adenine58-N1)-methyltransferase
MSAPSSTSPAASNGRRAVARAGDEVVLFLGYTQPLRPLLLARGEQFSTREGFWDHSSIIGKPFGSRVVGRHRVNADRDRCPPPVITVLRNTPELWSQALPHRTQIIVQTDIAVIIAKLGLRPGKVVAEAGTGSGSLTHSLARAVAPHGRVFTFDFHRPRVETARAEFALHGIGDVVVSGWRDVCAPVDATGGGAAVVVAPPAAVGSEPQPLAGYGLPRESVDAVFLDVPSPWDAVPHVLAVLRFGVGAVCSYSPCIEQTQRFCDALRASDAFFDIHTVEALAHDHVPIFVQKNEAGRRRARDVIEQAAEAAEREADAALQPAATVNPEAGDGGAAPPVDVAAASARATASTAPAPGVRGFCPQALGRGHTAYLTFARRRRPAPASA